MLRVLFLFLAAVPSLLAQVPTRSSIPAMWSQRLTLRQRDEAIRATMATVREDIVKKAEGAVVRGIDWLVKQQNTDGSWGYALTGEQTGLVLLAVMGSDNFSLIKERDDAVRRAISWLIRRCGAMPGAFEGDKKDPLLHATATLALLEYQTISGDRSLENHLIAALEKIISNQDATGGWRRTDIEGFEGKDPCLAAWNLLALQQAAALKIPANGMPKGLALGAATLAKGDVWRPTRGAVMQMTVRPVFPGGIVGPKTNDTPKMLTDAELKEYQKKRAKRDWGGAIAFGQLLTSQKIEPTHPDAMPHMWVSEPLIATFWWSTAVDSLGKATVQRWHQKMRDMLLGTQNPDGSWPPQRDVGCELFGSIEADPRASTGTSAVSRATALATLAVLLLESPYRVRLVTLPR